MEVRDPIHGAIALSRAETAVADDPWFQRLRNIRQTGFSHLPFPGATHTRHAHSLGVMHLAGRAFDSAYERWQFSDPAARRRFRQCVRLAALCHDLGHPPFSHCMEFAMPPLGTLGMSWYGNRQDPDRKATHEDYTIAILANTDLGQVIRTSFGFTARHVAALISHEVTVDDDFFVDGGLDHRRVLSQIVSSELDVDRMDYLVRDSYFSGARYGQVDVNWLVSHLVAHPVDDRQVSLALDGRALYAFDDFLIARHHMFLMVYFHHKSVVYEELLKRFVADPECDWAISADLDRYLLQDDVDLIAHLRRSSSRWARRIVRREPYVRLLEVHGTPDQVDLTREVATLDEAGVDVMQSSSTGRLSRYEAYGQKRRKAPEILVIDRLPSQQKPQQGLPGVASSDGVQPLADATQIFQRYAEARTVARLFVAPEDLDRARALLGLVD